MLAVKVKQNANGARTFLEIVKARYDTKAHIVFMCFALATNIIVSSMLLLGGSAVVHDLTGMDIYASNMLIPVGVALYVYFGGLRATLLCDWSHTTALVVIILYFWFAFYTSTLSTQIGSPTAMWNMLAKAAALNPVQSNTNGSYLTMRSVNVILYREQRLVRPRTVECSR
jgi:Na+/proline symporter